MKGSEQNVWHVYNGIHDMYVALQTEKKSMLSRISVELHSKCIFATIHAEIPTHVVYSSESRAGGTGWAGWAIALPDLAVDAIYNY